jgi:hypothetical protein
MRIQIRDPESFRPGIREEKILIRDKHPGSATLCVSPGTEGIIIKWNTVMYRFLLLECMVHAIVFSKAEFLFNVHVYDLSCFISILLHHIRYYIG